MNGFLGDLVDAIIFHGGDIIQFAGYSFVTILLNSLFMLFYLLVLILLLLYSFFILSLSLFIKYRDAFLAVWRAPKVSVLGEITLKVIKCATDVQQLITSSQYEIILYLSLLLLLFYIVVVIIMVFIVSNSSSPE